MDYLFDEMKADIDAALDHFGNSAMMNRYVEVTNRHGHSQALIDFINHDKSFGVEIGLESFETFSTQTQHELLVSKLNPDEVDALGMESLSGSINKFSNWLMGGGAVGAFAAVIALSKNPSKTNLIIAGVSYAALIGGGVLKSTNAIINGIYPHNKFVPIMGSLHEVYKSAQEIYAKLPTNLDEASWDAYWDHFDEEFTHKTPGLIQKWNPIYGSTTKGRVTSDRAGWTPDSYKSAVVTVVETATKIHAEHEKIAGKVRKIEDAIVKAKASGDADLFKAGKTAARNLSATMSMLKDGTTLINWLMTELSRVGKIYKVDAE